MRTDKGVVREHNEDAIGGDPSEGLIILADGMGGANAGEVASQLAVDLLVSQLIREEDTADEKPLGGGDLLDAMHGVNQAIHELSWQSPEYQGMGTTVVVGLFQNDSLTYAHVGDSRLYRWRNGVLEQLTADHTLIQEMVNYGDFATLDEARLAGVPPNVLTRAFGAEPEVAADLAETDLRLGDLYLFCSDGLTCMLSDQQIQNILEKPNGDLMELNDELVEMANSMGGLDNISVILARVNNTNNE
ncbi:MAG: protein phosphatase 2C domain-containing protein [Candidatus Thiodiazotropha sp. (ex Monitilora ramsayi)]|nr:protein phosphatase 2C domain-containing protein [Candidatus Thiodiazotropha sp. (ex Monitilora ramsayi)]